MYNGLLAVFHSRTTRRDKRVEDLDQAQKRTSRGKAVSITTAGRNISMPPPSCNTRHQSHITFHRCRSLQYTHATACLISCSDHHYALASPPSKSEVYFVSTLSGSSLFLQLNHVCALGKVLYSVRILIPSSSHKLDHVFHNVAKLQHVEIGLKKVGNRIKLCS
jgi:hypothetical protein